MRFNDVKIKKELHSNLPVDFIRAYLNFKRNSSMNISLDVLSSISYSLSLVRIISLNNLCDELNFTKNNQRMSIGRVTHNL